MDRPPEYAPVGELRRGCKPIGENNQQIIEEIPRGSAISVVELCNLGFTGSNQYFIMEQYN